MAKWYWAIALFLAGVATGLDEHPKDKFNMAIWVSRMLFMLAGSLVGAAVDEKKKL